MKFVETNTKANTAFKLIYRFVSRKFTYFRLPNREKQTSTERTRMHLFRF